MRKDIQHTISSAPRKTPHKTLLNHSPPSIASSGSSTNSVKGFSSSASVKYGCCCCCCAADAAAAGVCPAGVLERDEPAAGAACGECTTVGVTFRNDLKPTYLRPRRHRRGSIAPSRHTDTTETTTKKEGRGIREDGSVGGWVVCYEVICAPWRSPRPSP